MVLETFFETKNICLVARNTFLFFSLFFFFFDLPILQYLRFRLLSCKCSLSYFAFKLFLYCLRLFCSATLSGALLSFTNYPNFNISARIVSQRLRGGFNKTIKTHHTSLGFDLVWSSCGSRLNVRFENRDRKAN